MLNAFQEEANRLRAIEQVYYPLQECYVTTVRNNHYYYFRIILEDMTQRVYVPLELRGPDPNFVPFSVGDVIGYSGDLIDDERKQVTRVLNVPKNRLFPSEAYAKVYTDFMNLHTKQVNTRKTLVT